MTKHPKHKKKSRSSLIRFADFSQPVFELLENRLHFSITPEQMQTAYGFPSLMGKGQSIAVVSPYRDDTIIQDMLAFYNAYDLAPGTVDVTAIGTPASADTAWQIAESTETQWAHAFAPLANIHLVEANSDSLSDLAAAATYAGTIASVVILGFSFPDTAGDSAYNSNFTASGVTYLTPSGDQGAYGGNGGAVDATYPAASPDVIAVGGTTLVVNGSTYVSETAWGNGTTSATAGGSGGGVSVSESQPAFQTSTVSAFSTTKRTVPDLSMDADPATAICYADEAPVPISGTEMSCAMVAGVIASANQTRLTHGSSTLTGATQTLPAIYSLPAGDFNDITAGNTGYPAGSGYDLATGRGSPNGLFMNALVSFGIFTSTVTGEVFSDNNADDAVDGNDAPLAGQTVYLDENNNGTLDTGEPTAVTNSKGVYTFNNLAPGTNGVVRLLSSAYAQVTDPTFDAGNDSTDTENFGAFPLTYVDSTAGDTWTAQTAPYSSTTTQILLNGTVVDSAPTTLVTSLSFAFNGSGDALVVDIGNGSPISGASISVSANTSAQNDTLTALATSGKDTINSSASSLAIDGTAILFSNIPTVTVDPRAGTDAINVSSGSINIPAETPGQGVVARVFSSIQIAAGATLLVNSAAASANRTVIVANSATSLAIAPTGRLDLGSNDLIVRSGSLGALNALAASGYAGGTWTGHGLASSAAASDPRHVTALGVASPASAGTFDGQSVAITDVLVKYTNDGDATLDGNVDGSDYSKIDNAIANHLTGWANGDFNYDGLLNGSDYTLIDNAFNTTSTAPVRTVLGTGFNAPTGVAVNAAGDVFVADTGNSQIREMSTTGTTLGILGSNFNRPQGVAVDASGDVFVADTGDSAVKEILPGGTIQTLGSGFKSPAGVAVDSSGNVFVADSGNNAVKEIAAGTGTITTLLKINDPTDLAVNNSGEIVVTSYTYSVVDEFLRSGGPVMPIGTGFKNPFGVVLDSNGDVFITDSGNNTVEEYLVNGTLKTVAIGFNAPGDLEINPAGDIYVADTGDNCVVELSPPVVAT